MDRRAFLKSLFALSAAIGLPTVLNGEAKQLGVLTPITYVPRTRDYNELLRFGILTDKGGAYSWEAGPWPIIFFSSAPLIWELLALGTDDSRLNLKRDENAIIMSIAMAGNPTQISAWVRREDDKLSNCYTSVGSDLVIAKPTFLPLSSQRSEPLTH